MQEKEYRKKQINDDLTIRELIDRYLQYWLWFFFATAIAVALAFVYLKFTTPIYKAVSSIIIKDEENSSNASIFSELGIANGMNTNSIENELGLLRSKRLMNNTIAALNLNIQYFESEEIPLKEIYIKSPYFIDVETINYELLSELKSDGKNIFKIKAVDKFNVEIVDANEQPITKVQLGNQVDLGFAKFTVSINENILYNRFNSVLVKINSIEGVVNSYRSRLSIGLIEENSTLIQLTITDPVKAKAKDVLNQLVYQYNSEAIEDKNLVTKNTASFIDERLKIINKELDSVEQGKERFKEINSLTDIEAESTKFIEEESDYSVKRQEVETQLGLVDAVISYLNDNKNQLLPSNLGIEDGNINGMIDNYNSLVIERNRLLTSATEENPIVVKINSKVDQLKNNIKESLNGKRRNLRISKKDIDRQTEAIGSEISRVPLKERLFRSIERQQNVKESLYLFLLQKREENSLSLAATAPKAKIVDEAYALGTPLSPNPKLVLFTAIMAGLFIPFLVINANMLLDNKIKNKDDVEKVTTEIPVIGQLPRVTNEQRVLLNKNDRSILSETLRTVISNLHYVIEERRDNTCKSILVTSSVKAEGKTFFSVNLAKMLSMNDKRTLIIGGDLRNPQIHRFDTTLKNKPGLSNYLASDDQNLDDLILETSIHKNLKVLPSGTIPPNPAELLGKEKLALLFHELNSKFDFIVIDTPPSMILVDTFLMSKYVDITLYVIRSGVTEKKLLKLPVESKTKGKFSNIAFVINNLKLKNFEYGGKYSYDYGQDPEKKGFFSFLKKSS